MTANVITYRERSAAREIGKVLGIPPAEVDRLAALPAPLRVRGPRGHAGAPAGRGAASTRTTARVRLFARLFARDPGPAPPPRPALGRDGGRPGRARRRGAARAREHARPRRRPVGQGRLRRPGHHEGGPAGPGHDGGAAGLAHAAGAGGRWRWTWPTCPPTTPRSTPCCSRRTRSGVFQVESRAQMATLPRLKPDAFLRPRGGGRDHPARPHRGEDGAPLPEPPRAAGSRSTTRTPAWSRS